MQQSEEELYKQLILEHNKKPRNFGTLKPCTHLAEGFNPLCGDHFWLYLNCTDDGVIEDVKFTGEGCAISKASSSMMTEFAKGKTLEQALAMGELFHKLVKGELREGEGQEGLGKLKVFAGIWQYPARVKCAVLAWHALRAAINNEKQASTES